MPYHLTCLVFDVDIVTPNNKSHNERDFIESDKKKLLQIIIQIFRKCQSTPIAGIGTIENQPLAHREGG